MTDAGPRLLPVHVRVRTALVPPSATPKLGLLSWSVLCASCEEQTHGAVERVGQSKVVLAVAVHVRHCHRSIRSGERSPGCPPVSACSPRPWCAPPSVGWARRGAFGRRAMSLPRGTVTFGSLLREYRLAADLTQEALAERSGVSPRTIQQLEAGSVRPRRATAAHLAQALALSDHAREELERAAAPVPRRRAGHGPEPPGATPARPDILAVSVPHAADANRDHALVSLPRPAPTNIPWPVSTLLGRDADLAAIRDLIAVDHQRLVTLTGLGGSGKTRLSVQIAADLLSAFADGVWFVELAPATSPALVPRIVTRSLGVREVQHAPILETLLGFLRRKRLLLVLDNCEHLIDACARLVERLLTACPDLYILTTSREPLRIAGERRWQVQPLAIPDLHGAASVDALADVAAVRLFVERAQATRADFSLTTANATWVAQVCARLDGIPLAIELAASRIHVLAVDEIADRLDDCFRVLAGGTRVGPTRQQTMQAALDWSYDLLTTSEQATFRRLSTFAGGFDFEAADAICDVAGGGPDILDLLGQLVDKSLVVVERTVSGRRYRMLEPVRQHAHQLLLTSGEDASARVGHAAYYAALAERAAPMLRGPEQVAWLARLTREQDNLRAALQWAAGRGEADSVARLAAALVPFWEVQGSLREGRRWLDTVLAATDPLPGALRAKVLLGTGRLAFWQADLGAAAARFEESRALARESGRPAGRRDGHRLAGGGARGAGGVRRGGAAAQGGPRDARGTGRRVWCRLGATEPGPRLRELGRRYQEPGRALAGRAATRDELAAVPRARGCAVRRNFRHLSGGRPGASRGSRAVGRPAHRGPGRDPDRWRPRVPVPKPAHPGAGGRPDRAAGQGGAPARRS